MVDGIPKNSLEFNFLKVPDICLLFVHQNILIILSLASIPELGKLPSSVFHGPWAKNGFQIYKRYQWYIWNGHVSTYMIALILPLCPQSLNISYLALSERVCWSLLYATKKVQNKKCKNGRQGGVRFDKTVYSKVRAGGGPASNQNVEEIKDHCSYHNKENHWICLKIWHFSLKK